MPDEILIIAVVSIIFGTALVGLVCLGIYKLIKAKIDQGNKGNSDIDPQFFRALGEFKKRTENRLNNLESIVTDLEEDQYLLEEDQAEAGIEIESDEVRSDENENDGGNLRNMLNE